MDFGTRIKEQRAKLGISQQALSNEIGVSVDTIRSLEINRAKPSVETLEKLADLFGCSTDHLLGRDESQESRLISFINIVNQYIERITNEGRGRRPDSKEIKIFMDSLKRTGLSVEMPKLRKIDDLISYLESANLIAISELKKIQTKGDQ